MIIARTASILIALLLGFSATAKSLNLDDTVDALAQTQLLPLSLLRPFVILLVAVEYALGIGLLIYWKSSITLLCSSSLFAMFAGYSALRHFQDLKVPCSCFGIYLRMPLSVSLLLSVCLCVTTMYAMQALKNPKGVTRQ